jgi:hypothetical protein
MTQNVHPVVNLAILEHAPYIGFDKQPSSRLSAALSAAEDLTTLAALEPPFAGMERLSAEARELLGHVTPRVLIHRGGTGVRVEHDLDRFVNYPLALIIGSSSFRYPNV